MQSGFLERLNQFTVIAAFTGLSLLGGCQIDTADESTVESQVTASGNVVTTWAAIAYDAISRPLESSTALSTPAVGFTQMTLVQLAVYDVMCALREGDFEPFSYDERVHGDPDRDAAVATVSHRILTTRITGRAASVDAQYATYMAGIADGHRKTDGIALGEAVAAHYIALRANDHITDNPVWVQPPIGPGVWQPTLATPPVDYKITFVPAFTIGLDEVASYFPPPPPALTSDLYTQNFIETSTLGRVNSAIRTPEQTQLALWTGENSFRWGARNLVELAVVKELDPMRAARFFAMTVTSQSDAFQVGMSAKYHFNFWRPFFAVPLADTDGNPLTIADPTWTPLLNVNHPEYPAGHGFIGGSSLVQSVRAFFKTDAVTWTVDTVGVAGLTETSRTYTSLDAMGSDIMLARVLAGLHWRNSVFVAGHGLGTAVTCHVLENNFHRRGHHHHHLAGCESVGDHHGDDNDDDDDEGGYGHH
jgi:hypothetical protein